MGTHVEWMDTRYASTEVMERGQYVGAGMVISGPFALAIGNGDTALIIEGDLDGLVGLVEGTLAALERAREGRGILVTARTVSDRKVCASCGGHADHNPTWGCVRPATEHLPTCPSMVWSDGRCTCHVPTP